MIVLGMLSEITALVFIWIGMGLPKWSCGSMLTGCDKEICQIPRILLLSGSALISVAVILEVLCQFVTCRFLELSKMIILYMGSLPMLLGLAFYYRNDRGKMSGFFVTMGTSVFFFLAVFGSIIIYPSGWPA